jgi:dephospho-CoA kinase
MKQSNIKIAITGGIGSGKSTVAKIIEEKGYKVISCDKVYAELLCNKEFLNNLCDEFGDILADDGTLDRSKLSQKVFGDSEKIKKLNEITHPKIMTEAFRQANSISGLVFFEVPLLFEGGFEKLFNDVIVVHRDREKRLEGVVKRDNLTFEQVESRFKSQVDYDNLNFAKYYVIHNNYDLQQLTENVFSILNELKEKYKP